MCLSVFFDLFFIHLYIDKINGMHIGNRKILTIVYGKRMYPDSRNRRNNNNNNNYNYSNNNKSIFM